MVNAHALAEFHDEVDVRSLINDLVELHNIRMPQIRESVNLSVDSHLGLFILQVLLVVGLYCNQVLRLLVLGSSYDGECPCTNLEIYLEVL